MNARPLMGITMAAAMVVAVGCGGMEDGALEAESVQKSERAVCSLGADHDAQAHLYFFTVGSTATSTSAYPTQSCYYTVEVTGLGNATHAVRAYAGWGQALPSTEQSCTSAYVRVRTEAFYVWGGWQTVGEEIVLQGEWNSAWQRCGFRHFELPTFWPNSNRKKLRVSVMAYQQAGFFRVSKRATAGATVPPIIN